MRDPGRLAAVVLAAGEGKRLRSTRPKVLHETAGRPLLAYAVAAAAETAADKIVVVTSRDPEPFRAALIDHEGEIEFVIQDPPRGTGDALRAALPALADRERVLVTLGDSPLIGAGTLQRLIEEQEHTASPAVMLTAHAARDSDAGRVVRGPGGQVERIVEVRDATPTELEITEINAGVYVFDLERVRDVIGTLTTDNAQGEYYLTDVIGSLTDAGEEVRAVTVDIGETKGVNDRVQLADVGAQLRRRIVDRWLEEGVEIVDPASTFIDEDVVLEAGAVVMPFTFLEGATTVAAGAVVGPQARVADSRVESGAEISFSVVRGSEIGPNASVGPFASLRPGTKLGPGARLGTFVEAKQTTIGEGSKANHLSYLGDATIGRGVNVGAGTITCNWDGRDKHRTVIEDEVYVGSDTMLVAPVHLAERAATGAGSVVRGDVPAGALAVGVPARVIEGKGDRMGLRPEPSEEPDDAPDG